MDAHSCGRHNRHLLKSSTERSSTPPHRAAGRDLRSSCAGRLQEPLAHAHERRRRDRRSPFAQPGLGDIYRIAVPIASDSQCRICCSKYTLASSRHVQGVLGLHVIIMGGKKHGSLFPPHALHGLCIGGKYQDISTECKNTLPATLSLTRMCSH